MVGRWGMSDAIGNVSVLPDPRGTGLIPSLNGTSERTRELVDEEVRRIVDRCYEKALDDLRSNRDRLDDIAEALLEKETLGEEEAYSVAGILRRGEQGLGSDNGHRDSDVQGRARLRAGMWLLIREATVAKNLHELLPLVSEFGPSSIAFCTDDREPEHIAEEGHINSMVRGAVAWGIDPADAVVMASLHPALWHRLRHLGAVAPGRQADLLLLPDLVSFKPDLVLKAGQPVGDIASPRVPDWARHSVRIEPVSSNDFRIPWDGGKARVIELIPYQIVTGSAAEELHRRDGYAVADPSRDLAKVAVIERHLGTGRIGLGFVRGFGLQRGALASTVAHDAHNIVVVGVDDGDMARAVQRLAESGGGTVVVEDRGVRAELALPVAGLLSDARLEEVVKESKACGDAAKALGSTVRAPFQAMAFLALSVIPSLKITDRGLVDVGRFELVPLALDERPDD